MSKKPHARDMTDPGPPPEAALDAAVRALAAPVPHQPKHAAESAGHDAARYHGEPKAPPKAFVMPDAPSATPSTPLPEPRAAEDAAASTRARNDTTHVPAARRWKKVFTRSRAALVLVPLAVLLVGAGVYALRSKPNNRGAAEPVDPTTAPTALAPAAPARTVEARIDPIPPPPPAEDSPSSSSSSLAVKDVSAPPEPRPAPVSPPKPAGMNHLSPRTSTTAVSPPAPAAPPAPASAPPTAKPPSPAGTSSPGPSSTILAPKRTF
jgi:hypothetical protein